MAKQKMTLKRFEKTAIDKKADASGRHGKEGSAKDRAFDRKMVNAINKRAETKMDRVKGK